MNFMAKINIIQNPGSTWYYWIQSVFKTGFSQYNLRFGFIAANDGATGNYTMINGNPITLDITNSNASGTPSIIHPAVLLSGMGCSFSTGGTTISPGEYYIYLHGVFSSSKY